MTQFEISPYKTVTIRSYMKFKNAGEFARAMTAAIPRGQINKIGNLFWANGIVFRHYSYAPSDKINEEYLKGNLPMDHIEYAPMSQYRNEIEGDGISVVVIDASNHTLFNELTKWIKTSLEKKSSK